MIGRSAIKLMSQSHKNIQLIKALKLCIEQTLLLFKHCQLAPKALQNPKDVIEYCQNLLKMLQKLGDFLPKSMGPLDHYNKLKAEHDELNTQYCRILKENRQHRCEIDVLNIRVAELQAREAKLLEEKSKEKKYSADFQHRLNQIKRDSEEGLKKIIETSKSKDTKTYEKARSLPSIHHYANRQKLGLLLLMSEPAHKPPRKKSLIGASKI